MNNNLSGPARPGSAQPWESQVEDEAFALIDLLLLLADRKRLVVLTSLACGILAAVVAFLLPDTYTATALLLPPATAGKPTQVPCSDNWDPWPRWQATTSV